MSDESPSTKEITGSMPLFFYDAIGRIVPGALLMIGLLFYFKRDLISDWPCPLLRTFPKDSTAGYSLAILLVFFGVAHFVGVILASWSYLVLEYFWNWKWPLNNDALAESLGGTRLDKLNTEYKSHFGHGLDNSLNDASFLCSHYLWSADPNLGLMTARGDAEALSGRSLAFVSIIFSLLPSFVNLFCWRGYSRFDMLWTAVMAFVALGALMSFNHLRKKRVYSRFAMFLAVNAAKPRVAHPFPSRSEGTG